VNFNQFLVILWARKLILLLTLGVTFTTTLAVSLLLPKTYTATVSVVVDTKAPDPITGIMVPAQLLPGEMATQAEIISSHNVALKVVDRLKLTEIPIVQQNFQKETQGEGSIRDWLADTLLKDIDVRPSRESSIIQIGFSGQDPNFAAVLANTFADAYIQTGLELKVDPARRRAIWFDEQIQTLRTRLEQMQEKLSAFQQGQGIVTTTNRLDVEEASLAEISNQLVSAQAQMYDGQTRLKQMHEAMNHGRLQELPDILQNPLLQNMKAELVRAEGKLAEISGRYSKNHKQYQSVQAEVENLRTKLASETKITTGSIKQTASLAEQRVHELRRALDHQKQRILELRQQYDQLNVLAKEVENAQRTYDDAMQRASHVRLESQIEQTNIAVLNPAIPPLKASKPKVLLNLIVAIFLGTMLGTGFALFAELIDRRIRNRDDVMIGVDLPVLLITYQFLPPAKSRQGKVILQAPLQST
jgi:chain length determinant protein EpsF